ncbi:MAG: prohibitin family protein [Deltaproteobacteria bacterium]|nr:prohibitin family protein [Deltaproteobacteria bacterium]
MRTPLAIVLLLLLSIFAFYPHTTGPTEVGVRTVKWGLLRARGVEERVYEPGAVYFFPAVINGWKTFDTRLQNLEMTFDDFELKDKVVRTIARSRPRDVFGELKTEEFYISERRDEKAEKAKEVLNSLLNPYGVIVERVSTKDYRFNPAYQKAIEDKKVADQLAEKNKSATKAAEEEYRRKLEEAKGEVNKMVAEVDGRFRQAQIEADAYYEQQGHIAEAIETEGVAEAKGITEMNKALQGSGGEVMVKLKLAEALEGKKIVLLPLSGQGMDIKTTDINKLLELYGLKTLTRPKAASQEGTSSR